MKLEKTLNLSFSSIFCAVSGPNLREPLSRLKRPIPCAWAAPARAGAIFLLVALYITGIAWPAHSASSRDDPHVPTVSAREAALLDEIDGLDAAAAHARLEERIRPDSSAALWLALGNSHFAEDRLEEAAEAYRMALDRHPRFRTAVLNLARVNMARERPEQAVALLQGWIRDEGADAAIYLLLGHALTASEKPVSAETAYRHCLLHRAEDREALTGLARVLLDQDRVREAAALLRELTLLDPTRADAWRLRTAAAIRLEEYDQAVRILETARRLGRVDADLLQQLGDLYLKRGQAEDAVSAYESARSAKPDDPAPVLRAARGLVQLGEAERAESVLQSLEGLTLQPAQHMEEWEIRAVAARLQGREADARTARLEQVRIDPLHGPALLALGDGERERRAWDEAELWYERATRVPGYEAEALVRRAVIEVERRRYDRAVEHVEAALMHEPRPALERYLEQIRRLARLAEEASTP